MPKAAQEEAREALRTVINEIDGEIKAVQDRAAEEIRDLRKRRRELERALTSLGEEPPPSTTTPSSRVIAGPQAIEKVRGYLAEVGEAFQADITRATGLNSGTVTHALRALAGEGLIEATGERSKARSAQFRFLGQTRPRRSRRRPARARAAAAA